MNYATKDSDFLKIGNNFSCLKNTSGKKFDNLAIGFILFWFVILFVSIAASQNFVINDGGSIFLFFLLLSIPIFFLLNVLGTNNNKEKVFYFFGGIVSLCVTLASALVYFTSEINTREYQELQQYKNIIPAKHMEDKIITRFEYFVIKNKSSSYKNH